MLNANPEEASSSHELNKLLNRTSPRVDSQELQGQGNEVGETTEPLGRRMALEEDMVSSTSVMLTLTTT